MGSNSSQSDRVDKKSSIDNLVTSEGAPFFSFTINETVEDPRHAANFLEALCQMRINGEFNDPVPTVVHNKQAEVKQRFQCSECEYKAGYKKSVQAHIRAKHTGECPFVCHHCGKMEKSQSNLRRHERSHSQVKPYKCLVENCGREYADKKNIEKHMWREHVKQGQCQCTSLPIYESKFSHRGLPMTPKSTKKHCTVHSHEQEGAVGTGPINVL